MTKKPSNMLGKEDKEKLFDKWSPILDKINMESNSVSDVLGINGFNSILMPIARQVSNQTIGLNLVSTNGYWSI